MASFRGLTGYYLATPVFAALDFLAGVPVRIAIPDERVRAAYYVGIFGLGLVCRYEPRWAPWVGMGESAFNLFLLMLAVLLPLWTVPDALLEGGAELGRTRLLERVANLALGGTVLVVAFYRQQAAALRGLAADDAPPDQLPGTPPDGPDAGGFR